MEKTRVVFRDAKKNISDAVKEVFDCFGGAGNMLKSSKDVYIKVNAVDMRRFCYTDPLVIESVIRLFKEEGAQNVYVIENCTQGNFTRLVFLGSGITEAVKSAGGIPVFLDETKATPVFLETLESFIDISSFVYKNLILDKDKNLYVSIPKLKTHSMSQVTLSIKNQFGFVHQESRIADHNYRLHQKFADIYKILRPDFVLVDGTIATNHGHYPAYEARDMCIKHPGIVFGGDDPLAVDVAGAHFIGFKLCEVPHLELSALTGYGQSDIQEIEIDGQDLFDKRKLNLTHMMLDLFPKDLRILRGEERCCMEGCRRNTEAIVEVLHVDHNGKGDFTILMGKGIDPAKVEKIEGRVHIAGSCAASEWKDFLSEKLGRKNVTVSAGCNNLTDSIEHLCRHMKVSPLSLSRVGAVRSLAALLKAKTKGTKARIPKLF